MNRENLRIIFQKYIDSFEYINNKENNENYKWEIVQKFQAFDVDAPDFADMLSKMWKISENLIDSSQQLPFYALVDYAKKNRKRFVRCFVPYMQTSISMLRQSNQRLRNSFGQARSFAGSTIPTATSI